MTLTVGSLFSGIGGLELGLERAGMKTIWQVEKDEYCRKVLAKHWPDVPKYEDVKNVGKENLAPVDLICGGFPCQDISYAGKGAGLSGEQSGLWHEFARIIREMEPRIILVENVSALLTRGLDAVLGTLASFGYGAEWHCIPASHVGAPHRRDRIYIVAYAQREGLEGYRGERELDQRSGEIETGRRGDGAAIVADSNSERLQAGKSGVPRTEPSKHYESIALCGNGARGHRWLPEPNVGRVANGVPSRVDRLRGLGNAVVPQVAELIGRWIVEADEAQAVA